MEELKNVIAENIADLRKKRKLTQAELAEKLNYSDKAVSKWERGESVPDIAVLKSIADMFGVSVDYLLILDHKTTEENKKKESALGKRNRTLITLLAVMTVWLIATAVFAFLIKVTPDLKYEWMSFVYAVPCAAVVLLIFNCIWGERKSLKYLYISLIVWSFLASVYMTCLLFFNFNFWTLFVIGVPAQIIVLLWSGLKFRK